MDDKCNYKLLGVAFFLISCSTLILACKPTVYVLQKGF